MPPMMVPQALPAPLWTKVSTPWAETRNSGGVLCAMYEHAAAQTAEWVTPTIASANKPILLTSNSNELKRSRSGIHLRTVQENIQSLDRRYVLIIDTKWVVEWWNSIWHAKLPWISSNGITPHGDWMYEMYKKRRMLHARPKHSTWKFNPMKC